MNDKTSIPDTQYAVQLVGPDELRLNKSKSVPAPGEHQILARVESVSLCFSDLKLLHQFSGHPRKGPVVTGIAPDVLENLPSYVPDDMPTVPGHETSVTIVAVGNAVREHKVGDRAIVQADWRQLRTAASNGAFGYNFEGALQEYVLFDERIVIEPQTGQHYLIPVSSKRSSSAATLVEPWACVECSYATSERRHIKPGGRLLVVVDPGRSVEGIAQCFAPDGKPAKIIARCAEPGQLKTLQGLGTEPLEAAESIDTDTWKEAFDDIIYFGSCCETIEQLNDCIGRGGIIDIVTGGEKIARLVNVGVGRVHYGPTRWVGTTGTNAADGYKLIPANGELRNDEKIIVIGAGGPMGQMHVIRNLCGDAKNISLVASDFDDERLESLRIKAQPLAKANGHKLRIVNPKTSSADKSKGFTYYAVMAPVGELVVDAIRTAEIGAIINIFAGIPAPVKHPIDLNACLEKRIFMFGTSGSLIEHMIIVRDKVETGQLDTNCSVDAVSGMAGATEGIEAVKNRTAAGKIVVYPQLHEMPLIPLEQMASEYPSVAGKLNNGMWTASAEKELLKVAK